MNNITIKVILDTRRSKRNDKYPLRLRITLFRVRKYYHTGIELSQYEWNQVNAEQSKPYFRQIRNNIAVIENRAVNIINGIAEFSFIDFEKEFFAKEKELEKNIQGKNANNLKKSFNNYISSLQEKERYGSANMYKLTLNSLAKFKKNIDFQDITPDLLYRYEKWFTGKGHSITTVGIYLRHLRCILNNAITENIFDRNSYPFGKRKYIIPKGFNKKKALSKNDIIKINSYNCTPYSTKDKARDFWLLSYLCNGMNMIDIAQLKWKNLQDEVITFQRQKTKNTTKGEPLFISVSITPHIQKLINKWGTQESDFIFSIIGSNFSVKQIKESANQFTKMVNKQMTIIGKELGVPIKLTTYVARHSFSTILVTEGGAPLEFVSQALGHKSILTTQKYFAGFDIKAQQKYVNTLL